jgi:hypothetical protein
MDVLVVSIRRVRDSSEKGKGGRIMTNKNINAMRGKKKVKE